MSVDRRAPRLHRSFAAALLVVAALAGCSSPGATGGAGGITVTDAWARPSSMTASAGGAYMVIANTGAAADALVGATSPAAATVEVHETFMMPAPSASGGMGMGSPAASGGMMGMRPIPRLEIPAGGTVELKPGSYHVMLIGLVADLEPGATIEITLRFEKAGEVKVSAEVRAG
jgi:copper(I)-binding protein